MYKYLSNKNTTGKSPKWPCASGLTETREGEEDEIHSHLKIAGILPQKAEVQGVY